MAISAQQILEEIRRRNNAYMPSPETLMAPELPMSSERQSAYDLASQPFSAVGGLPNPATGAIPGPFAPGHGGMPGMISGPGITSDPIERAEMLSLGASVGSQQNELEARTGEPFHEGEGFVQRLFDILSRGNYASANAIRRMGAADNPVSAVSEFYKGGFQGLIGREKTTFADVLEDMGVENNAVKGTLGFVGDVVLDPTTYIGAGIIKAGGKAAIQAKAAKTATETLRAGETARLAENAAKRAARKAEREAIQTAQKMGQPVDPEILKTAKQAAAISAKKEVQERAMERALHAAAEAEADEVVRQMGQFQLKIMGQPVMSSEKLYKMGAAFTRPLRDNQIAQNLAKAFIPAKTFPELTNQIKRVAENKGVAAFEHQAQQFYNLVNKLDLGPDDMKVLAHGLEKGDTFAGTPLEEIAKFIRNTLDDMFDEEVAAGILKQEQWVDNYLPHYYTKGSKAEVERFKNARRRMFVGGESKGFTKERSIATLNEAKDYGLKPIEDAGEIFLNRLKEHHQLLARREAISKIQKEYGVNVLKGVGPKGRGKRLNQKLIKDLNLKPLHSKFADEGVYVPEEIANTVNRLEKLIIDDDMTRGFLRFFDKATRVWKTSATVVNPGHHLRSLLGDLQLAYLNGVTNPRVYDDAMAAIAHQAGRQGLFARNLLRTSQGGVKIGNQTVGYHEINRLFRDAGMKSGFYSIEYGRGVTKPRHGLSRMGQKAMDPIRNFTEAREDMVRMGHMIDILNKKARKYHKQNPGKKISYQQLEKWAEDAGVQVRKWNIDYGDLTEFEQKVMKRVMPFYTFMRKNAPIQFEALFLRPGRQAVLPKAQTALEQILGVREDADDTYNVYRAVPKWVRDMSATRILGGDEPAFLAFPTPFHETFVKATPIVDLLLEPDKAGAVQKSLREIVSMTNPAVRAPYELAIGKESFTGAPVEVKTYGFGVTPPVRTLAQIAQAAKEGDSIKLLKNAINWSTGLGYQPIRASQQKSELRRREDVISHLLRIEREKPLPEEFRTQ